MNAQAMSKTCLSQRGRGVLSVLLVTASVLLILPSAVATQPPPPITYELDMSRSGGNQTCKIAVEPPTPLVWHVDSINEVYVGGTTVDILAQAICPSEYRFDHWWTNDPAIHGTRAEDTFIITQDTTLIAYFLPLPAKVTGFTTTDVDFNSQTGYLYMEHTWGSTTGNLADLGGQKVFEVLAHPSGLQFDPDILNFLCTGLQQTSETYTYPSPWDSFGPLPRITKMAGPTPAQNGYCPDTVTRLHNIPAGCVGYCSYTLYQWIVASAGNRSYLVSDKNDVERGFNFFGGVWNYCVASRGNNFCTEKTW